MNHIPLDSENTVVKPEHAPALGETEEVQDTPVDAAEEQPDVLAEDNEQAVEEEEDGDGEGDEDEGCAAEYRSLLFRVADREAQEEQRVRQQRFALRMARREALLLSRVVRQQQLFLASHLPPKSSSVEGNSVKDVEAHAENVAPEPLTSSDAVARIIEMDVRLTCSTYRAERAQQRQQQLMEAAAQLESFAHTVQQDLGYHARLREECDEVAANMMDEVGIDLSTACLTTAWKDAAAAVDGGDDVPCPPSPSTDTWERHNSSLTTLGGTLAKVHTLFEAPACRTSMAVMAAHLAHLGRQSQQVTRELQYLIQQEAQLEAALQRSRHITVEWSVYASHAQQAREMRDMHSPVTVAEMRAMALHKLLLRRRQELQNALAIALLREAEHSMNGAPPHGLSAPSAISFSSPPAEVTAEKMKAASDDCARREVLRDRLRRELLFLKKCAQREFGVAWMAKLEDSAVRTAAASSGVHADKDDSGDSADVRRFLEVLEDNLRASSYDGVARVVRLAALPPLAPPDATNEDAALTVESETEEDGPQRGTSHRGLPLCAPQPPPSPAGSYSPRVRVLALLESVQTRVNSLTALLIENAKHWQRVKDAQVEATWGSSPRDESWSRTAVLLLRRCSCSVDGDGEDEDQGSAHAHSLLLGMEQQLLDAMSASESRIYTEMNAALAQLHAQSSAPLLHAKREVLLLVRLLQLSDETLKSSADGTRTTPALESAMQLLCSGADPAGTNNSAVLREGETSDPFDALLRMDEAPFRICLPRLPAYTGELQAAMEAVSTEWQEALRADSEVVRASVTTTQVSLEQYAQYSMADVPALLEQVRADVKSLKGQMARCTAQGNCAATFSSQVAELRRLLEQRVGSERSALEASVQQARVEQQALEAEVLFLRACKLVSDAEKIGRQSASAAEEAERVSLVEATQELFLKTLQPAMVMQEGGEAAAHPRRLDVAYDGRVETEETLMGEVNWRSEVKVEEDGDGEHAEANIDEEHSGIVEEEDEPDCDPASTALYDAPEVYHGEVEQQQEESEADEVHCAGDACESEEASANGEDAIEAEEVDIPSAIDDRTPLPVRGDKCKEDATAEEEGILAGAAATVAMQRQHCTAERPGKGCERVYAFVRETEAEECNASAAAVAQLQDEEVYNQEEEHSPSSVAALGTSETADTQPFEESLRQSSENEGRMSVLGSSAGILGDHTAELPPILNPNTAAGDGQPPEAGAPPVLLSPKTAPSNAVLEDNPFYSGFGLW
ncbi:hypothetical protein ABL78_4663 [Leptomonas seymouri]|uniref:Uncharacterized protein n=1 Tax=Leptomonas seymouri TaxID=5684 RepID=A0A0N1PE03_LEPSE|nr:hypothetical protein ABL78_4663 [Leptomonas seymouri]|eukprot:KPI86280.1 hypothetical protein ABL78_4663 [Leptomonas seymouri]